MKKYMCFSFIEIYVHFSPYSTFCLTELLFGSRVHFLSVIPLSHYQCTYLLIIFCSYFLCCSYFLFTNRVRVDVIP